MMGRLREVSKQEDVPVSDIIRRAAAMWLERFPTQPSGHKEVPTIDAGRCLMNAEDMKEALYE